MASPHIHTTAARFFSRQGQCGFKHVFPVWIGLERDRLFELIEVKFMFNKIAISSLLAAIGLAAGGCKTVATNHPDAFQHSERIRTACIEGRRRVCGKILEVFPGGLVVDSGYTNLLRQPLTQSWLVPGTVAADRAKNLLEGKNPGDTCIGLVFLTNFPKGKKIKPAQYDYVIIEGYPAGQYTYTSMGTIERTIRRFSASLDAAVKLNLEAEGKNPPAATEVK
jgi:hypothetical protein